MAIKPLDKEGTPNHRFTYNGKELEEETGYLDYHARQMDNQLGRFMSVDPLAEKYLSISPYVYVANNPLKFIDPDGKQIKIGENIYSYEEDRDYSKIEDEFERNIYEAIDKLYASEAMKVTIGEGENAKEINVLDILIKDEKNTTEIKASQKTRYDSKNNVVEFNPFSASIFLKDHTKPNTSDNIGTNSPMAALGHELFHNYNDFHDPEYQKRRNDKSTDYKLYNFARENVSYTNQEEEYVTEKLGNQMLKRLKEDQRSNYGANHFSVPNVTDRKHPLN